MTGKLEQNLKETDERNITRDVLAVGMISCALFLAVVLVITAGAPLVHANVTAVAQDAMHQNRPTVPIPATAVKNQAQMKTAPQKANSVVASMEFGDTGAVYIETDRNGDMIARVFHYDTSGVVKVLKEYKVKSFKQIRPDELQIRVDIDFRKNNGFSDQYVVFRSDGVYKETREDGTVTITIFPPFPGQTTGHWQEHEWVALEKGRLRVLQTERNEEKHYLYYGITAQTRKVTRYMPDGSRVHFWDNEYTFSNRGTGKSHTFSVSTAAVYDRNGRRQNYFRFSDRPTYELSRFGILRRLTGPFAVPNHRLTEIDMTGRTVILNFFPIR